MFTISLKSIDDFDRFDNEVKEVWLTLYDTTNGGEKIVEYVSVSSSNYWLGLATDKPSNIWLYPYGDIVFKHNLENFHNYKIGFNINQGDDMNAYTDNFFLSQPNLNKLNFSSTENSIAVEWELAKKENDIVFDFKEIYLKVNGKKHFLGSENIGQSTVNGLKSKKEYLVVFGYSTDKLLPNGEKYEVKNELNFKIYTKMIPNFSKNTIITSFVLLIILLLIILILGMIILYWNYQRRKVSGLALVAGEQPQEEFNYNCDQQNNEQNNEYYETNSFNEESTYIFDSSYEDNLDSENNDIAEWEYE